MGSRADQRCSCRRRVYDQRHAAIPAPCFCGCSPFRQRRSTSPYRCRRVAQNKSSSSLPFQRIPYLRACASDIRNRKQIKRDKTALVPAPARQTLQSHPHPTSLFFGRSSTSRDDFQPAMQPAPTSSGSMPCCSQKRLASVLPSFE